MKNTCPICYEEKTLVTKFECNHQVCNECFQYQLEKSIQLNCCICRTNINNKLLTVKEQEIINNKEVITDEPSLTSQLNIESDESPEWMLQNYLSLTNKFLEDLINL